MMTVQSWMAIFERFVHQADLVNSNDFCAKLRWSQQVSMALVFGPRPWP